MNVGIVGLGLIGGSLAKAYKEAGHNVYARDTDRAIQDFSLVSRAVDAVLNQDNLSNCELVLLAVYPEAAIEFLDKEGAFISPHTMVIDCCGTKKNICQVGFEAASQYGFTFVGGHPMAGIEQSGFKHSEATLFEGATMILVPPSFDDIELFARAKKLLEPAGFEKITITSAKTHDEKIAFTSQLPHLVSNAFIKSPTSTQHKGFSAGSYGDLTRVAWLNENMWTELFLENRENLLNELDSFIESLHAYRRALSLNDASSLRDLLREGKQIKEEVDRKTIQTSKPKRKENNEHSYVPRTD